MIFFDHDVFPLLLPLTNCRTWNDKRELVMTLTNNSVTL